MGVGYFTFSTKIWKPDIIWTTELSGSGNGEDLHMWNFTLKRQGQYFVYCINVCRIKTQVDTLNENGNYRIVNIIFFFDFFLTTWKRKLHLCVGPTGWSLSTLFLLHLCSTRSVISRVKISVLWGLSSVHYGSVLPLRYTLSL